MKKFLSTTFFYILLITTYYVLSFSPAGAASNPSTGSGQGAAGAFSDTTASNAGSLYFIHQDHLGSVIAVSDEAGNVVSETKYEAYGDAPSGSSLYSVGDDLLVVPQNGQTGRFVPTEKGYTGQIKDQNTALQYYNARYYDSRPFLLRIYRSLIMVGQVCLRQSPVNGIYVPVGFHQNI